MKAKSNTLIDQYIEQDPVQFLIVGGCPRSGTTAMLSMLNASTDIGLIPEYNLCSAVKSIESLFYKEKAIAGKQWIGDINANKRDGADILVGDFLKYVPNQKRSFNAMNRFFFESVFGRSLKVVGEKLPRYWDFDIAYLEDKVGPIKIIHIARDPMAVMNSFMHRARLTEQNKDQWKYNDIRVACNLWAKAWNVMVSMQEMFNERFLMVKYEDLFDNRESTEALIADFLQVESSEFLSFVGEKQSDLTDFLPNEKETAMGLFGEIHRAWDKPLEELVQAFPELRYIEFFDEETSKNSPKSSQPSGAKSELVSPPVSPSKSSFNSTKKHPLVTGFCKEYQSPFATMTWPDLSSHPEFSRWMDDKVNKVPSGAKMAAYNYRCAVETVTQAISDDPMRMLNIFLNPKSEVKNGSAFHTVHVAINMLKAQYSGAAFSDFEIGLLHKQFNRLLEETRRYHMVQCLQKVTQRDAPSELAKQILAILSKDGAVPFRIGDADMSLLQSELAAEVESLLNSEPNTSGVGYDRATRLLPDTHPRVYDILNAYFRDWCLLEASKYYFGVEQKIHAVALHVCRSTDKHFTMTCKDLPTTDLVNLHFDPKDGMTKCILYLNDVTQDDGPFCYIPGSHRWHSDPVNRLAAKANEVTNYLDSPEHRKAFMRLPEDFRYCGIVGSMILDGTGLSHSLKEKEVAYDSATYGQAIFFDPGGLHRGGITRGTGERISLQIMLRPAIQGNVLPQF